MRSHPSPAPGDNNGALGTVCCYANGGGALYGPSSSCLSGAERDLTRLRAGRAQEETEGQGQSWAGAAGGAVGQGSTEKHRHGCRGKVREGINQRWEVVMSLGVNLVKIRAGPLHMVQGQTLPVVLGPATHLEKSQFCSGLAIKHPYYPSWPSSTIVGSGIQFRLHPSLSQLL